MDDDLDPVAELLTHTAVFESGIHVRQVTFGMQDGARVFQPVGCEACNHTGYAGRSGIHELFTVDDEARRLIHEGSDERELRRAASAAGMLSMREDGARWVESGETSPEEILRVTRDA